MNKTLKDLQFYKFLSNARAIFLALAMSSHFLANTKNYVTFSR